MAEYSGPSISTVNVDNEHLHVLATAVLDRGATFTFQASGISMRPFIRWGDRVTIEPSAGSRLRRGDIAFYVGEGGALMAHRVIGKSRDGRTLYIRGDGVWRAPESVLVDNVMGKVTMGERHGRRYRPASLPARVVAIVWHRLQPFSLRAYLWASALKERLRPV